MNSCCLKLYRAYSISFSLSNVGNFLGVEFWRTVPKFKKRKRKLLSCVPVLNKTWNYALSRRSRATTAKKCTKKRDARAELLFSLSKPFSFCRSRCRHRRRSSLNSDAVHSRHFQLSFRTFTWYEGDCNGTWANHEVLHLTYHKSDIGISVLVQPYLGTRHGEPELTQPRSKSQQRIKSQMTRKFFSPKRGGVSLAGRTPIWKQREFSSSRFEV